ncbi:NAD-dependent epimerase/dehydratase family protein [Pseudonocardia sp. TRM90224]|uniref:NAD-dependent epimerase/dehydratase family protein n=1 Tax=Pseudonocardia sp. TRM90224 TaxID=2812678 RepID=UPI001E36D162|nr:NAD-dependent epimerase/dehydratase family protein [Pseudonocardia sp. TRM90224]
MGVHVVVGASGGTGSAVCAELLAAGHTVRAVNRSGRGAPAGTEPVAADASDSALMRSVCAGADVVYHCVNPPFERWRSVFPVATRALIEAAGAAGARLVFADDTWMYGEVDGPMREDTPHRPVSEKGVLRAWLAEMLLGAHARGEVEVVIGRAPELYGPNVESLLGAAIFAAAVKGKTARWPGALDLPLTAVYIGDFARSLVTLGTHHAAAGAAWHVPVPPATTARGFMTEVFRQAGNEARIGQIPPALLTALKLFSPVVREGADLLYQFERPFLVDDSRYRSVIGGVATGWVDGIASTLAWYRGDPERTRVRLLPR